MRLHLIIIVSFLNATLFAQKPHALQLNYLGGRVLIHTPKIHVEPPAYSNALEFSYIYQTTGNKSWHQKFGFPEIGLNACYANYLNERFGSAIGIYPSILFTILKLNKASIYGKVGGGISLASKKWQRVPYSDSSYNIISSKVNNMSMFQLGIRYPISMNWKLHGGVHFFHVSNASARQPNFGINTYGAFLGLQYFPNGNNPTLKKSEISKVKNSFNVGLRLAGAFAEDKVVNGPIYHHFGGSIFGRKMYRNKNSLLFGADMYYNSKWYAFFRNNHLFPGNERTKSFRYSLFAGHEFLFGKFAVPLQLGIYLNRPLGGELLYQKLGLAYYVYNSSKGFIKNMFVTSLLKTHYANAEYAELGIGVLF